jgi:hypothetical protein
MGKKPIYFGQFLSEGLGVAIDQTPYDIQGSDVAGFFGFYKVKDSLDGFTLGLVDEAASIEHDDIGGLEVCGVGEAVTAIQGGGEPFGVKEVFTAS